MNTNQWVAVGIAVALIGVVVGVQYRYGWDNIGKKVMEAFSFEDIGESFALVLTDSDSTGAQLRASAQETEGGGLISNLLNRGKAMISSSPSTTTAVLMPIDAQALDELVAYGAISQADARRIANASAEVARAKAESSGEVEPLFGSIPILGTVEETVYKIPVVGDITLRIRDTVEELPTLAKKASAIKINPIAYAQYVADKTNTTVELASLVDARNDTALKVPLPFPFTSGLRSNGQMESFSDAVMGIFSDPLNSLKYFLNLGVEVFESMLDELVTVANKFAVMIGVPLTIVVKKAEAR